MKKIAFFMNSLYGGGAERVLQTLLNHFDYSHFDVTLYSFSQAELDSSVYTASIKYKSIFGNSKGFMQKIKGYVFSHFSPEFSYRFLIKEDYDVLIAFTEGEVTKLVSGAPDSCKKYAWVHTDLINNAWTDFLFSSVEDESKCYDKYNKIFCVSEDAKSAFLNKYSVDKAKADVFSNPVDSEQVIEKSKENNTINPEKRPLFVFVGRLEKVKGVDRLVKTVKKLIDDNYSFELWIIGDGSLEQEIKEYVQKNSLQDYIKMLGYQQNPYSYLIKADCLISPSYAEAYSMVSAEAIVLNKPVFATDCAGIKHTVGSAGVICQNSDEDFYLLLKDLLESKYDLDDLSENCKAVSKKFEIDSKMNDFYKAIEE